MVWTLLAAYLSRWVTWPNAQVFCKASLIYVHRLPHALQDPTVLRAVEFAAEAHKDQRRKTGEPYVSHCIEAALIVENMLPPTQLPS